MPRRTTRRPGGAQALPRPVEWREVPNAPWARLDTRSLVDLAAVRRALATRRSGPDQRSPSDDARPSAVLVPLIADPGGPRVLLTRRSSVLRHHGGQIAFPGGRIEPGESGFEAAVRETREEIGVDATRSLRLGELSAHRTVTSRSHIVPYVVELADEPDRFCFNDEVDRAFSVPLVDLVRPDTFALEHWVFPDREVTVPIFYLDDETIWGATARMLMELVLVTVTAR